MIDDYIYPVNLRQELDKMETLFIKEDTMSKELLTNDQKIEIMERAFEITCNDEALKKLPRHKSGIDLYKAMIKAIQEDEPEITGTTVTFTREP